MSEEIKKTSEEIAVEDELIADGDIIRLVNDDGEEIDFYHVATMQHKDKWYVVLQPAEEMEDVDEDEAVIFGLETDENGEDVFVPVEDEGLLDELFEEFEKMTEEDDNDGCGCDCTGCGEG